MLDPRQVRVGRVAAVLAHPRVHERLRSVEVVAPGLRFSVQPPFAAPPLICAHTFPVVTSTPPIASMNCGNAARLTTITWLILTPVNGLDGLDRERRAAVRVGRVDLGRAVPGNVRERVARDREAARGAAADPPQHHRVAAAARVRRVGARLLRAGRAAGRCPRIRTLSAPNNMFGPDVSASLRRGREVAGLDLRADQEQHDRQQDPRQDRDAHVLEHALPRPRAAEQPSLAPGLAAIAAAGARDRAVRSPPRRAAATSGPAGRRDTACMGVLRDCSAYALVYVPASAPNVPQRHRTLRGFHI